jgi:hypothetical protein
MDDVIPFYTDMLGFKVEMHPAPAFASLARGDLRLLLNRPGAGGAGQAMPDSQLPAPAGIGSKSKSKISRPPSKS